MIYLMLFAQNAQNSPWSGAMGGALRGALIGGAIGAVIGIVMYFTKKKK
jgi:hypothetical protein